MNMSTTAYRLPRSHVVLYRERSHHKGVTWWHNNVRYRVHKRNILFRSPSIIDSYPAARWLLTYWEKYSNSVCNKCTFPKRFLTQPLTFFQFYLNCLTALKLNLSTRFAVIGHVLLRFSLKQVCLKVYNRHLVIVAFWNLLKYRDLGTQSLTGNIQMVEIFH